MSMAIVHQLILIVGLLAVGYACRKLGVLDEAAGQSISKLLLSLTIPATAINAAIGHPLDNLPTLLVFFAVAAALFVAVPLVGKPLCHLLGWDETYRLMLTFGNTGFVGIPVCAAVLGEQSTFYVAMFMLVFNVAFFTWGVATMKRAAGYPGNILAEAQAQGELPAGRPGENGAIPVAEKRPVEKSDASDADGRTDLAVDEVRRAAKPVCSPAGASRRRSSISVRELLNPGIVSAVIAVLIFALQIPVPADLTALIGSIAAVNTPLAMIVIGASLASVPVRDIFNDASLYILIAIKMVVFPAILLAVLRLLGVDPLIIGIFVVLECMPVAGNLSMIAIQYHGDIALVSKATALTTLLFIPMVLAWVAVLGLVVGL